MKLDLMMACQLVDKMAFQLDIVLVLKKVELKVGQKVRLMDVMRVVWKAVLWAKQSESLKVV